MGINSGLGRRNEALLAVIGVVAIIGVLYFLFFNGENLRVLIYAIVFYLATYLLIIRNFYKFNKSVYHVILSLICYLVFQIILGGSPWLQLKEFELIHPNWQRAEHVQLVDAQSDVYRRSRSVSYAYMNVIYQYEYQGKNYSTEQGDLVRQYFLKFLFDEPSALRELSAFKLKNAFLDDQAVVLVNPVQPEESVYFYSQKWFDLRGSWLAKILWGVQLISGFVLLAILGLFIKKAMNPQNTIQTWSKPKRYAFIAVFFIVGWSVLFTGWILLMYIKNAP